MIELTPTQKSSQILATGYEPIERCIYIKFANGIYKYHDCLQEDYTKMLQSDSLGKYVSKQLAPNKAYTKLKEEQYDNIK